METNRSRREGMGVLLMQVKGAYDKLKEEKKYT